MKIVLILFFRVGPRMLVSGHLLKKLVTPPQGGRMFTSKLEASQQPLSQPKLPLPPSFFYGGWGGQTGLCLYFYKVSSRKYFLTHVV